MHTRCRLLDLTLNETSGVEAGKVLFLRPETTTYLPVYLTLLIARGLHGIFAYRSFSCFLSCVRRHSSPLSIGPEKLLLFVILHHCFVGKSPLQSFFWILQSRAQSVPHDL